MRSCREGLESACDALKMRMGATHLLMKTLPKVAGARLDRNPDAMRARRETVEHPFGTLKMRMGATHFLMKTLPKWRPRWRCTCSPTTSRV